MKSNQNWRNGFRQEAGGFGFPKPCGCRRAAAMSRSSRSYELMKPVNVPYPDEILKDGIHS